MKVKTNIEMDYDELDELVHNHFPNAEDYEFCAEEECGNNTAKTFNGIDGQYKYLNRESALKDFEAGRFRNTHAILHRLCELEAIPAGDYVITVCW